MQPIYQGKPPESPTWCDIPADLVPRFRQLGYAFRELVAREDMDRAVDAAFDQGVERAAAEAESYSLATKAFAKLIRALKRNKPVVEAA